MSKSEDINELVLFLFNFTRLTHNVLFLMRNIGIFVPKFTFLQANILKYKRRLDGHHIEG